MLPPPIPSVEWEITTKCNYKCDYCCQKLYTKFFWKHSSNEVVEAMFNYFNNLEGQWLIKISGGEPIIHPRFFEIVNNIKQNNHKFSTTTNFSLPLKKLTEIVDTLGDNFLYITASLHLTEIADSNEFIQKAIKFNKIKAPGTKFIVTSVLVEEYFDKLIEMEKIFSNENVNFELSPLKNTTTYVKYKNLNINNYIEEKGLRNVDKIRHQNLFGTKCFTGNKFFRVNVNGDVLRCYNFQPGFLLGNIAKGSFKPFEDAKPCLSTKCSCTVPANRNMIRFGDKFNRASSISSFVKESFTNIRNFKDFKLIGKEDN